MELFANLMPGKPTRFERSNSVGQKPVIVEGDVDGKGIQIIETADAIVIQVSDGSIETPFSAGLEDSSSEAIFWVATPSMKILSDEKYLIRMFYIDGGFLVALKRGQMYFPRNVEGADPDDFVKLARKVKGDKDELDKVVTPENMAGFFNQKDLLKFNRVFDVEYRELVYVGTGRHWVDSKFAPTQDSFFINEAGVEAHKVSLKTDADRKVEEENEAKAEEVRIRRELDEKTAARQRHSAGQDFLSVLAKI